MKPKNDLDENDRFVREHERRKMTGLSRSSWYELEAKGQVPRRVALSSRVVAWSARELTDWMNQRLAMRGQS